MVVSEVHVLEGCASVWGSDGAPPHADLHSSAAATPSPIVARTDDAPAARAALRESPSPLSRPLPGLRQRPGTKREL